MDNGVGVLDSSLSGYNGTINYETGEWSITAWDNGLSTAIATFRHEDEIKSEHILNWILYYSKALVQIIEGNTLRKASAIGITNDGDSLKSEGYEEKKNLEKQLAVEGRWISFCKKF